MTIVSDTYRLVVGVDTHAATHTVAVVDARTSAAQDAAKFPTSPAGLQRARSWVDRRTSEHERNAVLVVVEGIGSYGAVFADVLTQSGYRVVEAPTVPTAVQRGVGKSDALDAVRIAQAAIGVTVDQLREPRADKGPRAALRVLSVARDQMTGERTRAINRLTALVRTIDLGVDARRALTAAQIRTIAAWRARRNEDVATATARGEAIRLATQIRSLDAQLRQNQASIQRLADALAPQLQDMVGVGPVVAAAILIAWSHPGRIRSEAALASLAGTCPIPASSGNTVRHRLNRGGDRRLNRAIHTIVLTRMNFDPRTKEYVARREAEGRTKKEIRRSLKRYVTRQIFRTLAQQHQTQARVLKDQDPLPANTPQHIRLAA